MNCSNYSFGPATPADIQDIVSLVNEATQRGYPYRKPEALRTSVDEVTADFNVPELKWLVLRKTAEKTEIVATLLYKSESAEEASLHMFSSKYTGKNFGAMLLALMNFATLEDRKSLLSFSCVEEERLVNYYVKQGFTIAPRIKEEYDTTYLQNDVRKLVIRMEKRLHS